MKTANDISSVLVMGTGMMGPGIALSLARGGFAVALYGRTAASVERGRAHLNRIAGNLVEFELATADAIHGALEHVTLTSDLAAAAGRADMIVESVVEELEVKQQVFAELCTLCAADTILATNTSGISITKIAAPVTHPARFVGTHFWNPPYIMPLVEVVKGDATSDATLDTACQVIERAGKKAVRVMKDIEGFLGNRLQHALWREALALVDMGVASPADIDAMIKYSFALRMPPIGVFEYMDMVGIDLVQSCHSYLFAALDRRTSPSPVTTALLEAGDLGAKSGKGFFDWTPEKLAARIRERDREVVRQLRQAQEGQ